MDEMVYLFGFYGLLVLIAWRMTKKGTMNVMPAKKFVLKDHVYRFLGFVSGGIGLALMQNKAIWMGAAGGAIAGCLIVVPLALYCLWYSKRPTKG